MFVPTIHLDILAADATVLTIDNNGNFTWKDGTKLDAVHAAQLLKAAEQRYLVLNYRAPGVPGAALLGGLWSMAFSFFAGDGNGVLSGLTQLLDGTTSALGLSQPPAGEKELPGMAVQGAAAAADSLYIVLTQAPQASEMNRVLFKVDTNALKEKSAALRVSTRFSSICGDGATLGKSITNDAVTFIGASINKTVKYLTEFAATGLVFSDQAREALTYYNDRFLKAHDTNRKNKQVQAKATTTATDQVSAAAREEGRAQARSEITDALSKLTTATAPTPPTSGQ